VNAKANNNDPLAEFYRQRFRPEFRPIFDTWLATRPQADPKAPPTPFALPGYRSQHQEHARELESQSKALFDAGHRANHYADIYISATVVLATVLFFCGIIPQYRNSRVRLSLLGIAVLLLAFGLSKILVLPRAP